MLSDRSGRCQLQRTHIETVDTAKGVLAVCEQEILHCQAIRENPRCGGSAGLRLISIESSPMHSCSFYPKMLSCNQSTFTCRQLGQNITCCSRTLIPSP